MIIDLLDREIELLIESLLTRLQTDDPDDDLRVREIRDLIQRLMPVGKEGDENAA